MEAQSYSLTLEDKVSVEYITKHMASVQQVSTYSHIVLLNNLCQNVLLSLVRHNKIDTFIFSALHPEWRCASIWYLYPHLWIRPRWYSTSLPN